MDEDELPPERKLKLLQRLDSFHQWQSTHQRRLCLACGRIISGFEIKISQDEPGLLRLRCPTEDCPAGPADWVEPTGSG
jgi:hypothetical protein